MTKKSYPLIDVFKFISALTIIAIHTQPFLNYTDSFLYIPYSFIKCFAIPFFFVSSSYLFFSKIDINNMSSDLSRTYLKKWLKRLLQLYIIYSIVNMVLMFSEWKSKDILYWIEFILLGNGNGYLWFFAALIGSVLIIFGTMSLIQKIFPSKRVQLLLIVILLLIVLLPMILLQFYYGVFKNGIFEYFINEYYGYFDNVRNIVSGLYYCLIGVLIVLLNKIYNAIINRVLLLISVVDAYIEYYFVMSNNLCKEEYSTFLLSFVYIFLMLECLHYNREIKCSLFLRKASNVIYFQHRYVLIAITAVSKIFKVNVLSDNIILFLTTVIIMCVLTGLYMWLERTKMKKIIRYLY